MIYYGVRSMWFRHCMLAWGKTPGKQARTNASDYGGLLLDSKRLHSGDIQELHAL